MEGEESDSEGGDESGAGRDVGFDAQNSDGAEQNDDGQSGEEGGDAPLAHGVVALRPDAGGGIGFEEVDGEGCGCENEQGNGIGGRRIRCHETSQRQIASRLQAGECGTER